MNGVENNQVESEKPSLGEKLDDLEKTANHSFLVVGFFAFLVVFAYFVKFSGFGFSNNHADWGTLGDYIGGVLNPTISVVTLYWLTRSIILQKRELQETREALRDTAYSQSQQAKSSEIAAKSSEIAAKFQLLSIELEIISTKLASELSYQMQVLNIMNSDSSGREIYDRKGALRPSQSILEDTNREVQKLLGNRDKVLRAAQVIAPGLDIEIMLAKGV